MRILVYADLHAAEGHERLRSDPSIPLQRSRVCSFYRDCAKIIQERHVDAVWDLGDTTNDRTSIPIPTIDVLEQGISLLPRSEANIKLIGNHEQFLSNTSVHLGRMYASRFSVVENFDAFNVEGTVVVAFAYPNSYDELSSTIRDTLQVLRHEYSRIIVIGHCDVVGASLGSGLSLGGLSPIDFKQADLVLLGHVHKAQTISGEKIRYVGSPFPQNYGERELDKGVCIVDTNTLEVEHVPLTGYPRYDEVDYLEWSDTHGNSEDRYRVRLSSPEQASEFYANPHSADATPVIAYGPSLGSSEGRLDVSTEASLQETLESWVNSHPLTLGDQPVPPQCLLECGLSIVNSGN